MILTPYYSFRLVCSRSPHLTAEESRCCGRKYLIVKSYHGPRLVSLPRLLGVPHTLTQPRGSNETWDDDIMSPSTDTHPLSPPATAKFLPLQPRHTPHSHLHRFVGSSCRFRWRFRFPFARLAAAFALAGPPSRSDHARYFLVEPAKFVLTASLSRDVFFQCITRLGMISIDVTALGKLIAAYLL